MNYQLPYGNCVDTIKEILIESPKTRVILLGIAADDDLVARARAAGWSRLYWHTQESNAVARRLYDQFGHADDFVRYRLSPS